VPEELLVCLGDAIAVTGGQKIEDQAADGGDAERSTPHPSAIRPRK
jgi:hypothetical protein